MSPAPLAAAARRDALDVPTGGRRLVCEAARVRRAWRARVAGGQLRSGGRRPLAGSHAAVQDKRDGDVTGRVPHPGHRRGRLCPGSVPGPALLHSQRISRLHPQQCAPAAARRAGRAGGRSRVQRRGAAGCARRARARSRPALWARVLCSWRPQALAVLPTRPTATLPIPPIRTRPLPGPPPAPTAATKNCPPTPSIDCSAPACPSAGAPVLLEGTCAASDPGAKLVYTVGGQHVQVATCPAPDAPLAVSVQPVYLASPSCAYAVVPAYALNTSTGRQRSRSVARLRP